MMVAATSTQRLEGCRWVGQPTKSLWNGHCGRTTQRIEREAPNKPSRKRGPFFLYHNHWNRWQRTNSHGTSFPSKYKDWWSTLIGVQHKYILCPVGWHECRMYSIRVRPPMHTQARWRQSHKYAVLACTHELFIPDQFESIEQTQNLARQLSFTGACKSPL